MLAQVSYAENILPVEQPHATMTHTYPRPAASATFDEVLDCEHVRLRFPLHQERLSENAAFVFAVDP